MTDSDNTATTAVADAFERSEDPLSEYERKCADIDIDPFALFLEEREHASSTRRTYQATFDQWCEFMDAAGRHPICPGTNHVAEFITYLENERGNYQRTINQKLGHLAAVYSFWQDHPAFPHSQDFDPIQRVRSRHSFDPSEDEKEFPNLTLGEIRTVLWSISHLRDRLIVLLQLKLGLRASELCNIKLSELRIEVPAVNDYYDDIGTHWTLHGRPNAVYIPHDRDRNKSGNPRVLPLDDETRGLLRRYLLTRPTASCQWLFLAKDTHRQLAHQDVTAVWKDAFHPIYEETERNKAVTSHFGRHRFTTFWRVEQHLPRPLVQYMRGDSPGTESIQNKAGIDEYIHTYYEDVAPVYRAEMYQLLSK